MASPYTAAYTTDFHMATYELGKVYCLAWPTKNHAAATCTNQYIPDTELKLYVSTANPSADPTQTAFKLRNINGITSCRNSDSAACALGKSVHVQGSIDCEGFQRAPKFCENTDKALAHACFRVPSDLGTGHFVFQWYWQFNRGDNPPYTTCWDAEVVASGAGPDRGVTLGTKNAAVSTLCQGGYSGAGDCKCTNNYNTISGSSPSPSPSNPTPSPTPTTPAPTPAPPTPTPSPPTPTLSPSSGSKPKLEDNQLCVYRTPCAKKGTTGKFTVKLKYSVKAKSVIVVDLLDTSGKWYAKGIRRVAAGSGLAPVTVKYSKLARGTKYIIKSWLVSEDVYNNDDAPWEHQLDFIRSSLVIGSTNCSANYIDGSRLCSAYSDEPVVTPTPTTAPTPASTFAPTFETSTAPSTSPSTSSPSPTPTTTSPQTPSGSKCIWDTDCTTAGCVAGLQCVIHTYWSQCVEPVEYTAGGTCTKTADWGCGTKGCCNPNAICGSDNKCRLPCMQQP